MSDNGQRRPLKIVVVSSTVFRLDGNVGLVGYGGLEQIAWECARGLAALGHSVGLVAPDGSECPGVTTIPVGPERMPEARAYGGFPPIVYEGKVVRDAHPGYWQHLLQADAVIAHDWGKWAYLLKMEGRLQAPVLAVMHAPVNTMVASKPPVPKPCVVCISDDQKAHYEALFSPAEARRCYNGIDLDFYRPLAGVKRTNRFLFLARFSSVKSPDLAIEACLKADVPLDLVGDHSITNEPELYNKCMTLAANSKTLPDGTKQIRVFGGVPRGECVRWFSQAYCLIHATPNFREPFGLSPVEAMACECPVIGWRYGALPETVKTGSASTSAGRLVDTFEELVSSIKYAAFPDPVYDGERVADTWRRNCREWASQFSVDAMVRRYEELCYEAVETGGW